MDKSSTKNRYELLSMSDSDSYSPHPVPEITVKSPIRRKRLKKRLPSRKVPNETEKGCCRSEGRIFSFSCVFVIFFCWLIILTWMVIVFNAELRRFDNNIMTIVAGNQAYPDVLQKCHSLSKDLQRNQTDLYSRLSSLTTKLDSFSSQLQEIREKLKVAAIDIDANDVTSNLTMFSSELNDFNATLLSYIDASLILNDSFHVLKNNVTNIEDRLKAVEMFSTLPSKNNTTSIPKIYEQLVDFIVNTTTNFASMNETLSTELYNVTHTRDSDYTLLQNLQYENQNMSSRLTTLEEKLYSNGILEKIRDLVNKTKNDSTQSSEEPTTTLTNTGT